MPLRNHRADLAEDHLKARRLAEGLAIIKGLAVEMPETNIVLFDIAHTTALSVLDELHKNGVAMVPFGPHTIRATTHRDLTLADIDRALGIMHRALSPLWSVS